MAEISKLIIEAAKKGIPNQQEDTVAKDKPKMSVQTRIALNEAAPDDVELKTRDKVYKGVKTGSAKVAMQFLVLWLVALHHQ